MTNMQRLVLVLAFIFAVLLGVLVATSLVGGKGGPSTPTASPSASGAAASLPAPSSSAPASASASASPSASASATPSPTPTPAPAASIIFVQMGLDATNDANGTTRAISIVAQNGPVTVKVTTESGGNSQACLVADSAQVACHTGISSTLTTVIAKPTSNLQVTLRGDANATPVVDVAITFPATKPKVTIRNARFDGTDAPTTNGLQVVTTPRANGLYHVAAAWGGHPFLYELDLIEQGGPGLKTVQPTIGATKLSQSFAVAPPHGWMIVVKNTETGFGATALTATFTWP